MHKKAIKTLSCVGIYVVLDSRFMRRFIAQLRNLAIVAVVSSLSTVLYDIVKAIFVTALQNKNNACDKRNLICLK